MIKTLKILLGFALPIGLGYSIGKAESMSDIYRLIGFGVGICVAIYIISAILDLRKSKQANKYQEEMISDQDSQWGEIILEDGTAIKMSTNSDYDNNWHMEDRRNAEIRQLAHRISLQKGCEPHEALPEAEMIMAQYLQHMDEKNIKE